MTSRRSGKKPIPAPEIDPLAPPLDIFRRRLAIRRCWSVVLLALLTVVLLSAAFAPWGVWWVAYFALVPWAFAMEGSTHGRWAIVWGWLSGLIFWAGNLYWLWWVTLPGYAALVIYLSIYWLIAAVLVRTAMRRDWPMWFFLPLFWVALEYARTHVISGFPWFFLAHSQYAQPRLIQIADVTGQYGVSFFVAMVNGAIIDVLVSPLFHVSRKQHVRLNRRMCIGPLATLLVLLFLLVYGTWRLNQDTQSPGPLIGVVQRDFPLSLYERTAGAQEIVDSYLAGSESFAGSGCELLLWPETMLPKGANREFLETDIMALPPHALRALAAMFFSPQDVQTASDEVLQANLLRLVRSEKAGYSLGYYRQVVMMSNRLGCPILAGGASVHYRGATGRWTVRNSVLAFDTLSPGRTVYSKIHLVPFSEYVPFEDSWPAFHRWLRSFVPPQMEQLEPGRQDDYYRLTTSAGKWRVVTPICYEGVFARDCRRLVNAAAAGGGKGRIIMANLSNDGWFVWKYNGRYHGSTEHRQHLAAYCFRAVENRVPVVRAVNTGISASIDSNGRIVAEIRSTGGDTMIPGTMFLGGDGRFSTNPGPRILVDCRASLYSKLGDVFVAAVSAMAMLAVVWMIFKWPRRVERKKK